MTALTDAQWNFVSTKFPLLAIWNSRDKCLITAPTDRYYNCVSWSVGVNNVWINPPRPPVSIDAFYLNFGYEPSTIENAVIDGYRKGGILVHASRKDQGSWSSKLGKSFRMIHPRYELQGEAYGLIEVRYSPIPGQPNMDRSVPKPRTAEEDVAAAEIAALVERYAEVLPILDAAFDQNWDAWTATWEILDEEIFDSSEDYANGPAWDALVAMGPAILPQIVAKLEASDDNIFGCELYNVLQTDQSKKVDPTDIENFSILNNQAKKIVQLYGAQARSFDSLATDWGATQRIRGRSNDPHSYTSGPAYEAIRDMGKVAVPLIMEKYTREPDGWWHELLHEIEHGRRSGTETFDKPILYKYWIDKVQGIGDVT